MKGFVCLFVTWMVSRFCDFYVGEICRQKNETTFMMETAVPSKNKFEQEWKVRVQISVKVTEECILMALAEDSKIKSAYVKIDPKATNVFQMLSLAFDALVAHYIFNYNESMPY